MGGMASLPDGPSQRLNDAWVTGFRPAGTTPRRWIKPRAEVCGCPPLDVLLRTSYQQTEERLAIFPYV